MSFLRIGVSCLRLIDWGRQGKSFDAQKGLAKKERTSTHVSNRKKNIYSNIILRKREKRRYVSSCILVDPKKMHRQEQETRNVCFSCDKIDLVLRLPVILPLTQREKEKLDTFYRLTKNFARHLIEFAANRFEQQSEEACQAWRIRCSTLRNLMLNSSSPLLASLSSCIDWAANGYEEIVESCRPASFDVSDSVEWLKKVENYFEKLCLLYTIYYRWLLDPSKLEETLGRREVCAVIVEKDCLVHQSLFAEFKDAYLRGTVRYPIGGHLPPR